MALTVRVAVVADLTARVVGGAVTFQRDVIAALAGLAAAGGCEFGLVGASPADLPPGLATPAALSFIDGRGMARAPLLRSLKAAVPGAGFLARAAGLPTSLDRRLRRWGADLVWFLTPLFLDTELPYFYTVWDLQHRRQPWFPEVSARGRWTLREAMYQEAIGRAARVIVPNEAARQELQVFYGVLPERSLALAQPTPSFALAATEPAPPSATVARLLELDFILYPAQFWPHKNHATLLRALQRLRAQSGRELHAVLTGADMGNAAHVRRLAANLGLGGQVHMPGFVAGDDLVHLYRRARALAFPSFFGPENLPPLEAMALGCPVLAADVPGARDQLGEAARLLDPVDAEAWAAAIADLDGDPAVRGRLVAAGHARARAWSAADYARAVGAEIQRFSRIREAWPTGTAPVA